MPPDNILWDGSGQDIDDWLDKVLNRKGKPKDDIFIIDESEIEG